MALFVPRLSAAVVDAFAIRPLMSFLQCGSGKSTLALRLARELNGGFFEGGDHHSEASRDTMRRGIALCDRDRELWLDALSRAVG